MSVPIKRLGSLRLRPLLQDFIHPVRHILEDRGGGKVVETRLRRDAGDGVEPDNDTGKFSDEGDGFDRFAHVGGGMSTFRNY